MFCFYWDMEINTNKNNIYFGSKPLHYVNLTRLKNGVKSGSVKAVFSKLNPSDEKDIAAIRQIKEQWKGKTVVPYYLCDDFLNSKDSKARYFAIELLGEQNLAERIIGFRKLRLEGYDTRSRTKKLDVHACYVATKPELSSENPNRDIKGIGETLLIESIAQAKKHNADKYTFQALHNSPEMAFYHYFFKKIGIKPQEIDQDFRTQFIVDSSYFDTAIDYGKKQLGINFSERI